MPTDGRDLEKRLELVLLDMEKMSAAPAPWVSIAAVRGWLAILKRQAQFSSDATIAFNVPTPVTHATGWPPDAMEEINLLRRQLRQANDALSR